MSELRIAVLGAGVVGLTTALEVQKVLRTAHVDIIAERFERDTTSYVAAGLFRPGTSFAGANDAITRSLRAFRHNECTAKTNEAHCRKWVNDAYQYWDDIRTSAEAFNAGITQLSGYIFSTKSPRIVRNHYIEKLVPLYRRATDEELQLCPGNWKHGSFFTTILTETLRFLPWATNRFLHQQGRIIPRHVRSFSELQGLYDALINCTGLGAMELCNDFKLVPIRGQVTKVKAEWVKTFFYGDYDTYIIPGFNGVTLGGCRNYDSYDLGVNKHDYAAIKERCESMLPSLKTAQVIEQKVGLRPHRDPVRVEKEILRLPNGSSMKIVHNYGHGGYGVTTAPGTAKNAVQLLIESLSTKCKL